MGRSATIVPAVYLFTLSERENVHGLGRTKDLRRRSQEHQKKFGAVELEVFCYVALKYFRGRNGTQEYVL